jgi:DNA replication protein DnaC
VAEGTRKHFMESAATVPLLIIDDFGMRKLPLTAAEDLLEIIMRRYERTSTLLASKRPTLSISGCRPAITSAAGCASRTILPWTSRPAKS